MSTLSPDISPELSLTALSYLDLPIGQPLEWPIYDADRSLLLDAGEVIGSERECDAIFAWSHPHRYAARRSGGAGRPHPVVHFGGLELVDATSGIELRLGNILQMEPRSGTEASATARLLGASPNGMLFIGQPYANKHPVELRVGESLQLKSFSGTDIFRFVCTVEAVHQAPTPYALLSAPGQCRKMAVRTALRVRTKILARLHPGPPDPAAGKVGAARMAALAAAAAAPPATAVNAPPDPSTGAIALITDLSEHGASVLVIDNSAKLGDSVLLSFRVRTGGMTVTVTVPAKIRKVAVPTRTGGIAQFSNSVFSYLFGLQFDNLDVTQQLAINCLVSQQIIDDPGRVA